MDLQPRCSAAWFGPNSKVTRTEDTGTGMAADGVPKAPIELQGGTLALESEVGDGTIVTICFPSERVLDAPAGTEIENIEIGTAS